MKKMITLCLIMALPAVGAVNAKENVSHPDDGVKALSGMSIVGNDEAPKALYIVPWKSSEVGDETVLDMPANSGYHPVDREEFRRKLDYYDVSTKSNTGR